MADSASFSSPSATAPAPATVKTRRPFPNARQVLAAVSICLLAGALASALSFSGAREWFPGLLKPSWTPPAWLGEPIGPAFSALAQFLTEEVGRGFGVVSLALYLSLAGVLAYLWAAPLSNPTRLWALRWFWVQLGVSVAWSGALFALRSPGWGYLTICLLWFALLALLWTGSKVSRAATILLLPYFAWTTFASCLNFGILGFNVLKPKVEKMDADPRNDDPYYRLNRPNPSATPVQLD